MEVCDEDEEGFGGDFLRCTPVLGLRWRGLASTPILRWGDLEADLVEVSEDTDTVADASIS